ncbi:MAG: OmpA family protein [Candidatus Cloacimonetes bacterium]|jgi:outer membrane protein OmpA-like peptidoglycan-associated protein|nr:OmpA family protein [Candidatus Cloacimonadota bacterium]
MSKIKLSVLIPLLLLAFIPAMYAFESTMSVEGGVNFPQDDVEGENVLMGSWAVSWDLWCFGDFGLGINPWFTNLKVKNGDNDYHSSLEGINLYLKFKPTKVVAENFPRDYTINRVSPFIALGAGWSTHNSKDEYGNVDDASPDKIGGHLTFPYASIGFSLLSKWNTTLDLGLKYTMFSTDKIDLVKGGDFNDALLTPYLAFGMHFGRKEPLPKKIDPEIVKLRKDLNATDLRLNEVIGQLNVITMQLPELQKLQMSIEQSETNIVTLQTQYDQMNIKVTELTNKVNNLEQRISQVPTQKTPSADVYASEIREIKDAQSTLAANMATKEDIAKLEQEKAQLSASLNQVNNELAEISQKLEQLDALTAQVQAIKGAADVSAYAKELADLRNMLDNYEKELATIKEDTVNLHQTDNELAASINDLRSRLLTLSDELSNLSEKAKQITPPKPQIEEKPQVVEKDEITKLEEELKNNMIHFATNSTSISEKDKLFLNKVADFLIQHPEVKIEVQGHTDNTGSAKINETISYNRAKSVANYLISRGVPESQLVVKGYGPSKPIASNKTAQGRATNRRVQLVIIK